MKLIEIAILLHLFHIIWACKKIVSLTGGVYHKNKYMDYLPMVVLENTGPKMCLKQCMKYTDCKAVNLDYKNYVCQLLNASSTVNQLSDRYGFSFTEKTHWTQDPTVCWPHDCPSGTVCLEVYPSEQLCIPFDKPCDRHDCQHGSTCINGARSSYSCQCLDGYFGQLCEGSLCDSQPCLNGGSCAIENGTAVCTCVSGYYGDICESNLCDSQPCLNGGDCSIKNGAVKCACINGYYGDICEDNPCIPDPCQNGGDCTSSGTSSYNCACPSNYLGNNCQFNKNSCDGRCSNYNSKYNCQCDFACEWNSDCCSDYDTC